VVFAACTAQAESLAATEEDDGQQAQLLSGASSATNACCKELLLTIAALREELDARQARDHHVPGLRCPLEQLHVLTKVFTFLGSYEWLYVGGVSRHWRGTCKLISLIIRHHGLTP
jgi:hypothetical protein